MRLPKVAGWLRAGACSGLVCAIAAGLVSFAWPDQYVSSALLRFHPRYVPEQEREWRGLELQLRLNDMLQEVLSRASLERIIQSPDIDLYARERQSFPMEDVVDTMRRKHVGSGVGRPCCGDVPHLVRLSGCAPSAARGESAGRSQRADQWKPGEGGAGAAAGGDPGNCGRREPA